MKCTYHGQFEGRPVTLLPGEEAEGKLAEFVAGHQPDWVEVLEGPESKPHDRPPADKMVRPEEAGPVAKAEEPEPALEDMHINQLRRLAAQRGVEGAGQMTKKDLLAALGG